MRAAAVTSHRFTACVRATHAICAPCAKSVSQGVEPERGDQEAELLDMVLQLVATTSTSRGLAHQVQVLATFGERVRAAGILAAEFWQLGRAWAAMRHAHSVWKLLTSAFRWCACACACVTRWVACVCVNVRRVLQFRAESACVRRALYAVHTHLCASPMLS